MKYAYGVDVGGTTAKIGYFDETGGLLSEWSIPASRDDPEHLLLKEVADLIRRDMGERALPRDAVLGAGIGVPGAVDDAGMLYRAVNLNWGVFQLKEEFEALTGLPVRAGNDANVAALGEAWRGGGMGYRDLLLVTLGTGLGGGIIHDGRIYAGVRGSAGEIGHIHLNDEETEVCGCGNRGCFEQYGSAPGAVRLTKRLLAESDAPSSLRGTEFECRDVFEAARQGDALAKEATRRYGYYLGWGLANAVSVLNPEAVIIGGGVSKAGEVLIELLRPSFDRMVFHACRDVVFHMARLGNRAGIYGAAKLILEEREAAL